MQTHLYFYAGTALHTQHYMYYIIKCTVTFHSMQIPGISEFTKPWREHTYQWK